MTDADGNKVSISFELGNYAIDYHECEKNFYDMVVQFNDVDEIDELITTLTQLRNMYTMCG